MSASLSTSEWSLWTEKDTSHFKPYKNNQEFLTYGYEGEYK